MYQILVDFSKGDGKLLVDDDLDAIRKRAV
jgi:hypothetical protein